MLDKHEGSKPVYLQIVDLFYTWVLSEELKPGDQLPPVRKLAADLQVNPNTVQKALGQLDEAGIAISKVGSGRYITEDEKVIDQVKASVLQQDVSEFVKKMRLYSITDEQILDEVKKGLKEDDTSR